MEPADRSLFATTMSECLAKIVAVLQRQYSLKYSQYFQIFPKAVLQIQHSFISSKLRAQKNRTCDYLDNIDAEKKEKLLKSSISLAWKYK